MDKIEEARQRQDCVELKNLIHNLKGESATMFATELAELSHSLETILRANDANWNVVEAHLEFIQIAWSRTRAYLEQRHGATKGE